MPQNERHTKNKIAYYLTKSRAGDVFSQAELDRAIEKAGVHSKKTRKKYTEELEEEGILTQTAGGWTLAEECFKTGRISITITPDASTIAVTDAVRDAVRRFKPLAVVAVEWGSEREL